LRWVVTEKRRSPGHSVRGFVISANYFVVGETDGEVDVGGAAIGAVVTGAGLTTIACVCCLLCRRRCLAASAVSGVSATPARATTTTIHVFRNMVHPPRAIRASYDPGDDGTGASHVDNPTAAKQSGEIPSLVAAY
jgi:hypothetical protein